MNKVSKNIGRYHFLNFKFFLNYLKIGYFNILIELIKINHLLTYESPCITKKVVGHTYNSPPPSIRTNYQVTKVFSFLNTKKKRGTDRKRKRYAIIRRHWQLTLYYLFIYCDTTPPTLLPTRFHYPLYA